MSAEIGLFIIPAVALVGAGSVAYALAKHGQAIGLWVVAGLIAAFSASMLIGLSNAQGWDGLGYLAALIGLSAPGAAGFGLGGLIGWLRKPRQAVV